MVASLFGIGGQVALPTSSSLAEEQFIAVGGQTLFTLGTFTYVLGSNSLWVFKNGLKLEKGVGYIESSTSTVTLLTGATTGDRIDIVGFPILAVTVIDNTIFHSFPFFTAGGVPNNIPLDSSGKLPFYKADLTPSNIPII